MCGGGGIAIFPVVYAVVERVLNWSYKRRFMGPVLLLENCLTFHKAPLLPSTGISSVKCGKEALGILNFKRCSESDMCVGNEHRQYSQSLAIRRRDGSHGQLHKGKACGAPGGQELSAMGLDAGTVGSCSLLSFGLVLQ